MVLPANHAGHAGADGLVHQQVMQADEDRSEHQRNHGHPDQLSAVHTEEVGIGRALGQVDDPAQVTEQRNFDQGANQPDHQQRDEARPHLTQVIDIKRQDFIRWGGSGGVAENIDQLFKTTIEHWF